VPGLYAWLRRNPRLVDGALALLLIYPGGGRLLAALPFTLGMVVPVVFRRKYPVAAFAAVIAVGALQVLLIRRPVGADLSVLIVLYTLAACRPRRISLRGLAICLAGAAVATWRWHPVHPVDGLYTVGVETALFGGPVLLAWLLGDSARWRRGYYQALEAQPDMTVVGEAADGLAAVEMARRHPADVVVMDVRMPRLDGVEATRRICAAGEQPRVLMLTTFDLDEYAFAGLKAGASGFLLKDVPPAELLFAIRSVHAGDSVVAPSTTRRLIDRFVPLLPADGPPPSDLAELTEREREVLIQVAAALSNAEIATRLFVSEATVKTHVGRILAKLGLRDRVQAVVLAYESGLVKARGAR
jgi:DNA-binding NarL/FixJ family response regulator